MGGLLILNLGWERLSRSILTAFRFWLEFRKTVYLFIFDFFPTFYYFFVLKFVWNVYLGISVGAATSFTFDSFSILTRVWKTNFQLFPDFFAFFCIENSLGGFLILNLVWERLSRSILTAFRFRLEFRNSFFYIFLRFSDFFIILKLVWNILSWI